MNLYRANGSPLTKQQARDDGAGFWRPSDFQALAVELHGPDSRHRIHQSPLVPSLVIRQPESFAVYFLLRDPKPENRAALLDHRLVPHFRGVTKDLFLAPVTPAAEVVWKHEVTYTEQQVAQSFAFRPQLPAPKLFDPAIERAFVAALIASPRYVDEQTLIGLPALQDFHALSAYEALYNVFADKGDDATRADCRVYLAERTRVRRQAMGEDTRHTGGDLDWFDALSSVQVPYALVIGWAAEILRLAAIRTAALEASAAQDRQEAEVDDFALRDVA